MPEPEDIDVLSPDRPLDNPDADRLGYAPFAQHLAFSVSKMRSPDGIVIALYGSWGSGKTTVLNFICHYLDGTDMTVVQFNPWWFSGHEDLLRQFFSQLKASISKWGKAANKVLPLLSDFAEAVAQTPTPWAPAAGTFAKWRNRSDPKLKDVADLKSDLATSLKKQEKRILIVIDDIDRLTANETRQLFRVIKAIADFPNVVYLLAFDREVASEALKTIQGKSGEKYLEKIVQVPFELPPPDKTSLRKLLFEKLDIILQGSPKELFDQTYWGNVYYKGIDHYISTPRDISRLTNTLSITYPAIKGEVNPVDFIAIETLRVFESGIYDLVRKNPDMFAGVNDATSPGESDLRAFHDSWADEISQQHKETVKKLLTLLFPKLEKVWNNTTYGSDWLSTFSKQRRVSSPGVFPIYFRLAIPEGSISNTEMKAFLALAEDTKAIVTLPPKTVTVAKRVLRVK